MNDPIRSVLADKGAQVLSVEPDATVLDAVHAMNAEGVGAVLVMQGPSLLGIFTERDVLRRVVERQLDAAATPVADVMTRELTVIKPEVTVEEAMAVITERRIRHIPVVEEGGVVGLVSIGDLTRWVNIGRAVQVQQLVEYVTGQYPA